MESARTSGTKLWVCFNHYRKGTHTKYAVAILVFAALACSALNYSLVPWFHEHHKRAAEQYRMCAYRSAIDGSTSESEAFYRASLMEADKLKDARLVAEINAERESMRRLTGSNMVDVQLSHDSSNGSWLWPSVVQCQDLRNRSRHYSEIWSPIFQIVTRRERALSNNPWRLIELGDLEMELFDLEFATTLYQSAGLQADREKQATARIVVMDRVAKIAYIQGRFDSSLQLLERAGLMAREIGDKGLISLLLIHQGQVYCDSNRPADGLKSLSEAMKLFESKNSPLEKYAELLYGLCLSYSGKHSEGLSTLKQLLKDADEGKMEPAMLEALTSERLVRSYAEALVNAGQTSQAKSYFYRMANLDNPEKKKNPIDYERRFMTEAKRYRILLRHQVDLTLCELALKSREARVGKRHRGLINVLETLMKGYTAAREHQKAKEVQQRIQQLILEFGYPPNR